MFNFYNFFMFISVGGITPGPNNITSMTNASRLGFKKSVPFNLGMLIGCFIVHLLAAAFSAVMYAFIPTIKPVMLVAGAAYMLWMAWHVFTAGEIDENNLKGARFIDGILLQFVNPKIIIYAVATMSTYILPYFSAVPVVVGFCAFTAFVGFGCTLCWLTFGTVFHRMFSTHRKVINTVMALLLVYCAVSLFF